MEDAAKMKDMIWTKDTFFYTVLGASLDILRIERTKRIIIKKLFINLKTTSLNINGTDYAYADDVGTLYNQVKPKPEGDDEPGLSGADKEVSEKEKSIQNYLDSILQNLKKNEYMNANDMFDLQAYQETLKKSLSNNENLSVAEATTLSKILMWFPEYVSLTPIALTTPDADEVELKVSLQYKGANKPKEFHVGTYRTSGGLAVGVNSNIYLTGLKNDEVYTETVTIDGEDELRAVMDDNDQLSVGIGMNSELSFRTGSMVKPTINVGFFIPIGEEDISPYLALGPGISIGTNKVKFSLSGGWAFGKVNKISEKYIDRDLSDFDNLTNEDLSEKVWKSSWQIGIGLSYNLSK